ncbi:hypothetical protein C4K04_4455 [Pseudomonas chlororaphis]|uniref:Uncharacterized protein n=1 Tax=Pseudomonas chlororaphis TaxID=587753 RepID=A0A3G7TSN1_9PSED|nr:hypothetical protein C4K04_4455 [Pseudomonas chlororaphis]
MVIEAISSVMESSDLKVLFSKVRTEEIASCIFFDTPQSFSV